MKTYSKPVWKDSARWCRVPDKNVVHQQHKIRGLVIMLVLFVTALALGILSVLILRTMEIQVEKQAFESKPDSLPHGYRIRAVYLLRPKGEALIEIFKGDNLVKQFLFPAYKIWNIAAHADDIIDGLEDGGDERGLRMAAWNGIDGAIFVLP